jgi:hypothetical protein
MLPFHPSRVLAPRRAPGVIRAVPLALLIAAFSVAAAVAGSDEPAFTQSKYPAQNVVDQEFSLRDGGQLRIDVDDMDIFVKRTDGKKSRVQVFVAGPDPERALEYFEEHLNFELGESDNELTMTSDGPHSHWESFWRRYRRIHIWAIVSVPAKFNADIRTDDGDLRVDALEGRIALRTEDGDVETRDLRGPSIQIKSSDGDILATSLEADEIVIDTSDGDVAGKRFQAKRISLGSSDGDIAVERLDGLDISAQTSDGDIEIGASGKELRVSCSDGDMQITLFEAMAVDLKARDGDIRLDIPQSLHVDLELRGDDVSVRGGSLTRGDISRRGVLGSLNDGGPLVRARSGDGSIALRLR